MIMIQDGQDLPSGRAIEYGISLIKTKQFSLVTIRTSILFIKIMAIMKMLFRSEEAEMTR